MTSEMIGRFGNAQLQGLFSVVKPTGHFVNDQ